MPKERTDPVTDIEAMAVQIAERLGVPARQMPAIESGE